MTIISQTVAGFLEKNPIIVRLINSGIINIKALAELIIKQHSLKASTHAVMSALRRYHFEEKVQEFGDIEKVLAKSKISTKSRLVYITLRRDFNSLARSLPRIFNHINPSVGEVLRISEGRMSFKILIEQSKKDEILSLVEKSNILDVVENLGEINIVLGNGYQDVRGIRAAILNELSIHNVDIEETIGCLPEFMILLREKDIGKAHDALLSFFYR
ncbi:hypothetical protein HYV84_07170 [Candidatus Woesearchaeota archaeon]|nr:hypothetical protein [Candidatus Woesearchaeota archaeon]